MMPAASGTAGDRAGGVAWPDHELVFRDVRDPRVLQALRRVPRHRFVPREYLALAYTDRPLPIGFGQTVSQPYMVALMTAMLELKAADRVLELGTGSGYQTAVLSQLAAEVYSVEIIPELAQEAGKRLDALGCHNVHLRVGDGYWGWPEAAPFDAIIVTAAPDHIPQPLLEQLADGGRMVLPLGPAQDRQVLWRVRRSGGRIDLENVLPVVFVPLTHGPV